NNSRGLSAVHTAMLRTDLINTFTFGLTRIGLNQTGTTSAGYQFDTIDNPLNYSTNARGFVRIAPVYNLADDLNWTKGRHPIAAGVNIRIVRNSRSSYTNSYTSYSFSRNTLLGLGGDIGPALTAITGLPLTDSPDTVRALGDVLGLVNQYSATYNFGR